MSAKDDLASFHARIFALDYNNNNGQEDHESGSSGAMASAQPHTPEANEARALPDSYNELRCQICAVQMNSTNQAR